MRTRPIALAILAVLVQSLGSVTPARAADPTTVTFGYTGGEQVFDVPAGVTSIRVVLVGGRGYDTGGGSDPMHVEGDLVVAPGSRLYVEVGGDGAPGGTGSGDGAGGFNGGGNGGFGLTFGVTGAGGGGASDIRTIGRSEPNTLASRLVVAAGGGGAGFSGVGGDAGLAGSPAGAGGGAGTSSAGGAPGAAPIPGNSGSLGTGGNGGSTCAFDLCADGTGGGGGGGGYFGGGGGGAGDEGGGGGGGGSSYTGSATNLIGPFLVGGTSVPSVSITYDPDGGSANGVVDATVTVPTSAACLELSTTSIDFGSVALGATDAPASPTIGVTNCSGSVGLVYARGTDATGLAAAWDLVDSSATCADSLGVDAYHLRLAGQGTVQLSTENKSLGSIASGATTNQTARLDTACPGSTGGGTTMSFEIRFLATEG